MKNQKQLQNIYFYKSKTSFIILLLVTLLLNGCANSSPPPNQEPTVPEVSKEVNSKKETATNENQVTTIENTASTIESDNSYQIVTKEYNKDNIHIKYPQLSGLSDEKKQTALNEFIENDILDSQVNRIYESNIANETTPLSLDLDYQVKLSTPDVLSFAFEGSSYIEGGAHPNSFLYGLTLDLQNQKKLYLSNFTDINMELIEKIKNAKTVSNQSLGDINDEMAESIKTYLNNNLETLGTGFMIWSLEHGSESNFYVTDESLFVSLDVGHVLGDYAAFEIPGLNIANFAQTYNSNLCLPTENLVVRFDMKDSDKTLAVCMDKQKNYLIYRFGTKDKIEFEYPEKKDNSWSNFSYLHQDNAGESQSETLTTLTFQNGDYEYVVYERLANQTTFVGVKIINLSTKKETDRQGDASTFAGVWYDVEETYKNVSTTP